MSPMSPISLDPIAVDLGSRLLELEAAGTCVVGALMSGRIMETVNFLMVEVLIERAASVEAVFCMMFRPLLCCCCQKL